MTSQPNSTMSWANYSYVLLFILGETSVSSIDLVHCTKLKNVLIKTTLTGESLYRMYNRDSEFHLSKTLQCLFFIHTMYFKIKAQSLASYFRDPGKISMSYLQFFRLAQARKKSTENFMRPKNLMLLHSAKDRKHDLLI